MFLLNKLLGVLEATSNTTPDKIKIPRNNLYFLNGGFVNNEVINMLKDKPVSDIRFFRAKIIDIDNFVNVFKTHISLTSVTLTGSIPTEYPEKTASALSELIMTTTTITYLNLSSNELGNRTGIYSGIFSPDRGVPALSKAIGINNSITNLDLRDNELIDRDIFFLAEACKKNTSLKTLNLSWGYISKKGGEFFLDAFEINYSLTTLDLSHNFSTVDYISEKIEKYLERNKSKELNRNNELTENKTQNFETEQEFTNFLKSKFVGQCDLSSPMIRKKYANIVEDTENDVILSGSNQEDSLFI
ncbi:hypothetical protein [Rickettsia bellii]|uniref:Leucine-rich repeat protein n=1 Tax=Rickettsia bellii (strain RML369-C) TaxID=336407 RepID=Q1RI18_RICBR|nr:hypothetical protein [Rickettsia bellii]ABE04996.1 Leucine-rich repeat protein [Rickettsia bellii RML369-C]